MIIGHSYMFWWTCLLRYFARFLVNELYEFFILHTSFLLDVCGLGICLFVFSNAVVQRAEMSSF